MAIRINRVYTRTGDRGTTRLVGGDAVRKDSQRVEAYGCVDELNTLLGLARVFNEPAWKGSAPRGRGKARAAAKELDEILKRLQNELFDLGSELATPAGATWEGMIVVGDAEIKALERCIDRCQEDLQPLRSFILPGGGAVAAFLHQARTVCRRAEREVVRLAAEEKSEGGGPLRYLNRLSDLLFVLARWIGHQSGAEEYLWERGLRLGQNAEPPPPPVKSSGARPTPRKAAKKESRRAR